MKKTIFFILASLLLGGFSVWAETEAPIAPSAPAYQSPINDVPRIDMAPPAQSINQLRPEFKPENNINQSAPAYQPIQQFAPGTTGAGREGIRDGGEDREAGMRNNENAQNNEGDDRREQMEKQNNERKMNDFKRESKRMTSDIKRVKNMVKKFEKLGVTIPENLRDAIAKAESLISQIQNAKTAEDLENLSMDEFGGYMQTMQEETQKLEQLSRVPQMIKEAKRAFKQLQSVFTKSEAKAKKSKVNMGSLLEEWRIEIAAINQSILEAEQAFKNGQADEAMSAIQEGVFEKLQNAFEKQRTFEVLINTQKMMKNIDKEIKTARKEIDKLKKQKKDVTELENLFDQAVASFNELKQAISQPGVDQEVLIDAIEGAQNTEQEFYEALSEMTGRQFGPEGPQLMPTGGPAKGPMGFVSRITAQISGAFNQLVGLLGF